MQANYYINTIKYDSITFNTNSRTIDVLLMEDYVSWVSSLAARLPAVLNRRDGVIWRFVKNIYKFKTYLLSLP